MVIPEMNKQYNELIDNIKAGESVNNSKEFNEYINFFLDESVKGSRFDLYAEKMKEESLESLAKAKHTLLKKIFAGYIQTALSDANVAVQNKKELDAKSIIDQLGNLREIFKNHDIGDYKDFILQSDEKISELEVELLFFEPELNIKELDKLTEAFVKAFKKKSSLSEDKEEFQKKFFNHPLMQCLNAYSDFKTISKHIEKETISLGNYKNLIQAMLGLREKINAEEYQGFITFVIHEDLTYGLNNILKNESYKPSYLRDLLKDMADGYALENNVMKELIRQIKIDHTKNLSLNNRKELIANTSSIASLNDYGFDVNLKGHPSVLVFHGHSTENAGANQREQQANTAFTIRTFEKDTIGLTVLKDEITRTDHHSNFLKDFSHMMVMSKTEEIILTGLQFDSSNFKFLALNSSFKRLQDGDFLSSNHYIVKADIKRSQDIINNNLGKNDLQLICEKKNAYMGIVSKNKDLFKAVLETTSTNNQLSFQLFSKPFIEFIDAALLIEEDSKIKVFTNEEIETIQDILSVNAHNLDIKTAKNKCLKSLRQRDDSEYEEVQSYAHTGLSVLGVIDRETIDRAEEKKKEIPKNHARFFNNPEVSLEDCLEYLDNNPLTGREYFKGYKNKALKALEDKIISASEDRLLYDKRKKIKLINGVSEIMTRLREGSDIVFKSNDETSRNRNQDNAKKTLAILVGDKNKKGSRKSEELSIVIALLSLANLYGTQLIQADKSTKSNVREEGLLIDVVSEEDLAYMEEQDDLENKKRMKR